MTTRLPRPLRCLLAAVVILGFGNAANAANCPALPSAGAPHVTIAHATEVCHHGYVAMVDDDARVPRWVAYELTGPHTLGCLKRGNNFHVDAALPAGSAAPSDYAKSGYDSGHQAPAEDFAWDKTEESDSFSMANMAPQRPGLNRQGWERLEETVRAYALQYGPLAIYTGPVIDRAPKTIGKHKIVVPSAFWKIVVSAHGMLAFLMPNRAIAKGDLTPYETTIARISALAGVSFPFARANKQKKPPLWNADLSGWRLAHRRACAK